MQDGKITVLDPDALQALARRAGLRDLPAFERLTD
jgi:hypothetical protein